METLAFFKKYCKLKGLETKYAFGHIHGETKSLVFMNGETTEHLEYLGTNVRDGILYRVSPATCGYGEDGSNKCTIGKPNPACMGGIYSKNKCAIYFHTPIDLETFRYDLNMEEFQLLSLNHE